jgi:hypothetical protein
MYINDQQLTGPEAKPITSGPEFEAEREDLKKLKARLEAARREHEKRLAPPPLDLFPLEVFKRAGVTATTRVGKTTASLIQTVLERSRALRPYIGQKLGRVMIPKNFIHHDFDATFNNAYTGLHKIVIPAGSAEEKELITRRGFYHPPTDAIHLRPAANVGHALHEAIHKFSSPGFRSVFGGYLDEGVTQYFTDVVLVEQGLGKMTTHAYQDQLRCANQLVGLFNPDIIAKAFFQGAGLQDLASILVGRLNTNLTELATKLKYGDSLCKKIGTLTAPRPPASGASRGQPLAHARGVVPRGAFFGQAPAFFGQAQTPAKAAPMISKVGADRINLVAKTMTRALQLATDALPFLKTAAQKELLQQMIEGLRTFFPTGFGILNEKGEAVKGSARLRFETIIRQPGGAVSRPYLYDVRLFMSDQDAPFKGGDHRSIGDWASRIQLYARQISGARPQEMVGVAIHEMTHMLRALVRSFVGKFGVAAAGEFPSRGTAALLNFSGFAANRAKMEGHFARLVAILERQANIRFEGNVASLIADKLLEEVLAYVFTTRVGEAMAEDEARKMAKKTRGPGIGVGVGFEPMTFLKNYIRRHWLSDPALKAALETTAAQRAIADMSDDLRVIVGAMEKQVGP